MAEHECVQLVPIFKELADEQLDTIETIDLIVLRLRTKRSQIRRKTTKIKKYKIVLSIANKLNFINAK